MSFNFMAAVTICSDFGAPKIKSDTVSTVSPSISHEVMGPDAILQIFLFVFFFSFFFFWFGHTSRLAGPQFPDQGLNPGPAVKVLSPICWTAREFRIRVIFDSFIFSI